jgi:hypothetical protein
VKPSVNKDSLQEAIEIFQENYHAPTKAIVWAKALQEWARFIVPLVVIVFLVSLSMLMSHRPDVSDLSPDEYNVIGNLHGIVKFMDVAKNSINERQELYADLMNTIAMYAGDKPRQSDIRLKISTLTSSLSICNTTRRIHMRRLSKVNNPLSDPDIAASSARIAGTLEGLPSRNGPPLTAESEREQWNLLCKRCATELQKAQQELVQLLNSQAR